MDEIKVTGSIRLERYNKKNMAHFDIFPGTFFIDYLL